MMGNTKWWENNCILFLCNPHGECWVGGVREKGPDWGREAGKGNPHGNSVSQSQESHFRPLQCCSCLPLRRAQLWLLQDFLLRMAGPHPGVRTLLIRALAICEWIDQLISSLDFAVVQLNLWELPGLMSKCLSSFKRGRQAETKCQTSIQMVPSD